MEDGSKFYVDGDDEMPRKIEVTVGVEVYMEWHPDLGEYVIVGTPTTTDAGLYTDACEGVWAPELGTWIKNSSPAVLNAAIGAEIKIGSALRALFTTRYTVTP